MNPTPHTVALRCAGPVLLELPIAPAPRSVVWVASIRSAPHTPIGWVRHVWRAEPAGWIVPNSCIFGTVIEVGADITTGRRRDRRPIRWYGIAVAHEHDWLIAHGPHPTPGDAEHQAGEWLRAARTYAVTLHEPTSTHTPDTTRRPALAAGAAEGSGRR
jgi:hypothetical protein